MDIKAVNKPAVQPAPETKRSAEATTAQARETKKQQNEASQANQAQQVKPTVNTLGQVTGQRLNVTA